MIVASVVVLMVVDVVAVVGIMLVVVVAIGDAVAEAVKVL